MLTTSRRPSTPTAAPRGWLRRGARAVLLGGLVMIAVSQLASMPAPRAMTSQALQTPPAAYELPAAAPEVRTEAVIQAWSLAAVVLDAEPQTSADLLSAADPDVRDPDRLMPLSNALTQALSSAAHCADDTRGLATWLSPHARFGIAKADDSTAAGNKGAAAAQRVEGAADVASLICSLWGDTVGWHSVVRLDQLGPCHMEGPNEVCAVTLNASRRKGGFDPVGQGFALERGEGGWRFIGDRHVVDANARR
jgi:hypothetical protein